MKVCVVGFGSIGQRHARILEELGHDVGIVSRRKLERPSWPTLEHAFTHQRFDYVVVANETSQHYDICAQLAKLRFTGKLLCEKPLFASLRASPDLTGPKFVGYNLRFHPVLQELRRELEGEKIYMASIHCGQYLPTWRPERNLEQSYSASKAEGGGVLRDLSHELDYAAWIFGPFRRLVSLVSKASPLPIGTEDLASLLAETQRCPQLALHINYLDRTPTRKIHVVTEHKTLVADLIALTLVVNGHAKTFEVQRDATYQHMHQAVIQRDANTSADLLCSWEEGLELLRVIASIETSGRDNQWVSL